ncbi:DUF61 family protein [Methanophagales archaeon]|nr:MAG: DUF61 family protein [Methanophagales archaeon]
MLNAKCDDSVVAKTVRALNKHLPVERKALSTLLKEENPAVVCRDATIQRIRREELVKIAELIPEEAHSKLKLPIYIELTSDYGRGLSRVYGKLECEVITKILGQDKGEEEEAAVDEIFIHRADVRQLRRQLRTATQYAFFTSPSR